MIAIVDYDAGNIKSVEKALQFLGQEPVVTRDKETLLQAEKVIVPGVGAFGDAMGKMHQYGLVEVLREIAAKGTPLLGICLGLQLFFESSEETPGVEGLGLLPGKIVRIPDKEGFKIPHMGWNSITVNKNSRILKNIGSEPYVYFVHSYYVNAEDESIISAYTEYGQKLDIAVEKDNVFATQFHPEKSGETGMTILKNFIAL